MNKLRNLFLQTKKQKPDLSLDDLLYEIYEKTKDKDSIYDNLKKDILKANNIDEYEYYTKNVNSELKEYIHKFIFPEYNKNDNAHGIIHIKEVIRRSFALKETLKLKLNDNIIYTIASYHDLGKYIDHETHEKIAGNLFFNDENIMKFFAPNERNLIKEAIEDHRSSFEDIPRSDYGKLISSADRNTSIEMVFIRSFFVAKVKMPKMNIDEYLDFTFKRLSKRYSEEKPENMFFKDKAYSKFLKSMRNLLKNEQKFKEIYCNINKIKDRNIKVEEV